MVLLVLSIKGNKGWAHLEADEIQAGFDCFIGCDGKSLHELSHRFLNFLEFDRWVCVFIIDRFYNHFVSTNIILFNFSFHSICMYDGKAWIINLCLVHNIFIPRYPSTHKVEVKFVTDITNMVVYYLSNWLSCDILLSDLDKGWCMPQYISPQNGLSWLETTKTPIKI